MENKLLNGASEQSGRYTTLQFSLANPDITTTVSGSANPNNIRNWAQWASEPLDQDLLAEVPEILQPVNNLGHKEGSPENNCSNRD